MQAFKLIFLCGCILALSAWKFTLAETDSSPELTRAIYQVQVGNYDDATPALEKLRDDRNGIVRGLAYYHLALIAEKLGNSEQYWHNMIRASEEGNSSAGMIVARAYERGIGVEKDLNKARAIYQKLSIRSPSAKMRLGLLTADHASRNRHFSEGISALESDAYRGDVDALVRLGKIYHRNPYLTDEAKAESYYRRAIEKGSIDAVIQLVKLWKETGRRPTLYQDIYQLMLQLAKRDNVKGMEYVGAALATGHGVEKNADEAFKWNQKAAQNGSAQAALLIATTSPQAKKLLEQHASYTLLNAAHEFDDVFGQTSPEQSFRNYKVLASMDIPEALYQVAQHYNHQSASPASQQKAIVWYEKAAKKGHVHSMLLLAKRYEVGFGANSDAQKAFFWYKEAAKKGNGQAQYQTAVYYLRGTDIPVDKESARYWLERALKSGLPYAKYTLRTLDKES